MSITMKVAGILWTLIALEVFPSALGAEPTVILLGPNGVRPLDGSSGYNGGQQQQSIANRDESGSSGSRGFDLYSISAAIKERLQERANKKGGPRIIVIPQQSPATNTVQRSTYTPTSGSSSYGSGSGYSASYSSPYGSSYAPPTYGSGYSPYAAASTYSNTYAYPSYSPSYASSPSFPQPQSSNTQTTGSYGSPYAAASTPYATYAYPSGASGSHLSSYLSSLNPFSSIMSRINPFLMYPQLAALYNSY